MLKSTNSGADNLGQVHYYYGEGKGKTTAALGLALRALGAGLRVAVLLLAKTTESSEFAPLEAIGQNRLRLEAFGLPLVDGKYQWLVPGKLTPEQLALGQRALDTAGHTLVSGQFDLVIMDEFADGPSLGLMAEADLLAALESRAPGTEVALTGHKPLEALVQYADLVSEVRKVKHYFDAGVPARRGIEC